MSTIKQKKISPFYRNACITTIWLIVFYISIIQTVVIEIPNGLIALGIITFVFYLLMYSGKPFNFRKELPEECVYMLLFMAYMLVFGTLIAIDRNSHISQAITSLEYLFVLIVISSLIKGSGTGVFHFLLLVNALVLSFVFLLHPVPVPGGRFSISQDINPNGLGMTFATGIWAALYWQQRKGFSLIIIGALIALFGYCIMSTGSRKSLIAAGLTVFLWLIFCYLPRIKEKGGYKSLLSFFAVGILIVAMVFLFITFYSDSTIASRMGDLFYEAQEGSRSQMYRTGIEMLKDSPLFGIGFQGFKYSYGLYSHATIIEIPVSGGLLGTVLYFFVYIVSIKKTIHLVLRTKGIMKYRSEYSRAKMILVLWATMLFYTTCIIHPYQFDSYILFGIIFGETAYIESTLSTVKEDKVIRKMECKYLKA